MTAEFRIVANFQDHLISNNQLVLDTFCVALVVESHSVIRSNLFVQIDVVTFIELLIFLF